MRSIRFSAFGEPTEVLHVEDIEKPIPGKGEALLRVQARPINPSDLFMVRGLYGIKPPMPATPGFEGMGVIELLGEGVQGFAVGQRCISMGTLGTWQEYLIAQANQLVPVPDSVSDETAAQFVVNPLTAWILATEELQLEKGEWLLQTAAGSTLGRTMLQIAKLRGFRTINVVRRPEQVDELKQLGADEVICTANESIPDRVAEITRKTGVRAAIDSVGGQVGADVATSLSRRGVMITFGRMSADTVPLDVGQMIFRSSTIRGFWLTEWFRSTPPAKQREVAGQLMQMMARGEIIPPVEAKYDLGDVIKAVEHSEQSGRRGKVLLVG